MTNFKSLNSSEQFILCCDWGTSSFRLQLVDRNTRRVVNRISTYEGASVIYDEWKKTDSKNPEERIAHFYDLIRKHIAILSQMTDLNLSQIPVVISGMASSSIGMKELPYATVPFGLDGKGIFTDRFRAVDGREIILVSGLRTETDVMRGEEVQLIGLEPIVRKFEKTFSQVVILLPGTHSKHVFIRHNQVIDFTTSLTGELFQLLSTNGLLRQSVVRSNQPANEVGWRFFRQGVRYSDQKPLLQSLFSVRTNDLFAKISPEDNYHYMSGLLIGYELKDLRKQENTQFILCCPEHLAPFYENAIDELGLSNRTFSESPANFNQYMVEAQIKILDRFL